MRWRKYVYSIHPKAENTKRRTVNKYIDIQIFSGLRLPFYRGCKMYNASCLQCSGSVARSLIKNMIAYSSFINLIFSTGCRFCRYSCQGLNMNCVWPIQYGQCGTFGICRYILIFILRCSCWFWFWFWYPLYFVHTRRFKYILHACTLVSWFVPQKHT